MVIHDFTRKEIEYFLSECNFTDAEKEFFILRSRGITLDEIAEIMNIGRRTADNYSRRIRKKIVKVL